MKQNVGAWYCETRRHLLCGSQSGSWFRAGRRTSSTYCTERCWQSVQPYCDRGGYHKPEREVQASHPYWAGLQKLWPFQRFRRTARTDPHHRQTQTAGKNGQPGCKFHVPGKPRPVHQLWSRTKPLSCHNAKNKAFGPQQTEGSFYRIPCYYFISSTDLLTVCTIGVHCTFLNNATIEIGM